MEIKKFSLRFLYFLLVNTGLLFISIFIIHYIDHRYSYHNWETDSDAMIIPKNEKKDLLILGSSHARIFTRDKNHLRVENILHKSMLDIGKGGGEGGITTNLVMLKYFYEEGNSADQIVYFIDAWPFFSDKWNEKSYFLTNEPIDFKLLKICIEKGVDKDVLLNYFKSKYTMDWLQRKPKSGEINGNELKEISPEAVQKRLESLYIQPYNEELFAHYAGQLQEVVQLAYAHHSKLKFIFPSTLLDDTRGKYKVIELLKQFNAQYGTPFYDYADAIKDHHFYYDHDHLNTKGIVYFTEHFLKPVVEKE
jgi:hypothetical protein